MSEKGEGEATAAHREARAAIVRPAMWLDRVEADGRRVKEAPAADPHVLGCLVGGACHVGEQRVARDGGGVARGGGRRLRGRLCEILGDHARSRESNGRLGEILGHHGR